MSRRIALSLKAFYIVCALSFIALTPLHPWQGSFLLKPLPAITMALLIAATVKGQASLTMAAGFIFSAAGDVLLDIDRVKLFAAGLGAFLVAHVLYARVFLKEFRITKTSTVAALIAAAGGIFIAVLMYPELGRFRVPVLIYVGVIILMSVTAAFYRGRAGVLFAGAVIFMIADSLIGINKFVHSFENSLTVILSFYYTGQFLIGISFIRLNRAS